MALRHQVMAPTNIDSEEFEYTFDLVVEAFNRRCELVHVMNNAFGFGGDNTISVSRAVN